MAGSDLQRWVLRWSRISYKPEIARHGRSTSSLFLDQASTAVPGTAVASPADTGTATASGTSAASPTGPTSTTSAAVTASSHRANRW